VTKGCQSDEGLLTGSSNWNLTGFQSTGEEVNASATTVLTLPRSSLIQHYRQQLCTPVQFAVNSQTPSTASDRQEEDSPPTASRPTEDLPQRLSYSRAVQRAFDNTNRKRKECEERLIKLERASEAHDRQIEKIKRDQKSLNLVMYNIPEEGERAKNRFEAMNTLDTELDAAIETALNKHGEKDMKKLFAPPVAAERRIKFVADRLKPRPVRLVFSSLIYKHSFLEFSKISGKQDSGLMMISQNHNKLSEKV